MTSRLINPTKALGFSSLYLDFLAGNAPARQLFVSPGYQYSADQIDNHGYQRERLVQLLTRQNQAFGSSEKTLACIKLLEDPRAVCLFAGQQAGLFGGPLFSIVKAIATVVSARKRSEELGRPVIPVFWIAADDHDLPEVNHTYVINREGELCKAEYTAQPQHPVPVGQVQFSDKEALQKALETMEQCLGKTDLTAYIHELLRRTYTEQDTFDTAFGKLIATLTADYGLVLFSPNDAEAKQLATPLFRAILERHEDLSHRLVETNQRITQAHYHLQVEKTEQATHLFLNLEGRKPIIQRDGEYIVGEKVISRQELFATLETEPERFSPDVLTRPLMQSYLFPVVGQLGGPSEIAYFAQINPLFELFNLPVPVHSSRPTVTLLEKKHEKIMQEYDISFEDLTGDIEQVINRVLSKSFPEDIEQAFEKLRQDVFRRFEEFKERSLEFDPTLKEFAKQSVGKIDFTLKTFEGKVFSAHKKHSKEVRDRIYRLQNAVYPNRGMQDRTLNISYFVAKYGPGIISFMYDRIDPDQVAHQVFSLAEYSQA